MCNRIVRTAGAALIMTAAVAWTCAAQAQVIAASVATDGNILRQNDYTATDESDAAANLPARLQRQIVDYRSTEAPGTIIIDTPHTYLYFILGGDKAIRYGIGVGREGFTWSEIGRAHV